MLFSDSQKFSIGCDLSDSAVKIVQLRKARPLNQIISLAHFYLPKDIIKDGKIQKIDELADIIKKQLTKIQGKKILTKEAVINAPDSQTFIKAISLSDDSEQSLNDQVISEIGKHFPLEAGEAYFDWQIINEKHSKSKLVVAALSRQIADKYLELIKILGWELEAMEAESIAVSRALLGHDFTNNSIIIDLGQNHSSIIIIANQTVQFTITLPLSSQSINTLISQKLKISLEQADKAKIMCGLDEKKCKGALKILLDSVLDDISYKIDDAIDYYHQNVPDGPKLEKIILTGGSANLLKIDEILSVKLKQEVVRGNPMQFFKLANNQKVASIIKKSPLTFTTALGLAMRNLS